MMCKKIVQSIPFQYAANSRVKFANSMICKNRALNYSNYVDNSRVKFVDFYAF